MKRGTVAFILSLLLPGLGHAFNGQILKAVVWWASGPALFLLCYVTSLWRTFAGLLFYAGIAILLRLGAAIDAGRAAFRQAKTNSRPRVQWKRYAIATVLICGDVFVLTPANTKSLLGMGAYEIPSESMAPTIDQGDRLMANLRAFNKTFPNRGEIIVFRSPEDILLVKRVVAIGGDVIEGQSGRIIKVNGRVISEPYLTSVDRNRPADGRRDVFGPQTIPANQFFVLGDNRDMSLDSRDSLGGNPSGPGLVHPEQVVGKPLYFYWSKKRNKIGQSIR